MGNRVARWVALLPLVLVGSMMFWSVALGLGGLSLLAVTGLSTGDDGDAIQEIAPATTESSATEATATEPVTGHAEPITVHIETSAEPEDVNDNAGASAPAP